MEGLDNSVARMLYAIAMEASRVNTDSIPSPFEYNEQLDAFLFLDGSFAFDRESANPCLARALRLRS
jgi:hypothetical protein